MAAFLSPLAALATSIIDRVVPDKAAAQAAKDAVTQMETQGELAQMAAQAGINQTEASVAVGTKSSFTQFFIAGWRPAIGWLCGLGLIWQYFLAPFLGFFYPGRHVPDIDAASLNTLLFALLGMGVMRSVDKITGTHSGD